MKNNWSKVLTLFLVGASVLGTAFAFPFFGRSVESDEDLMEVRENIFSALENEDFKSWKSTIMEELTEERFNQMVTRHQEMKQAREIQSRIRTARQSGDLEELDALESELESLGLPLPLKGQGKGRLQERPNCAFS